MKLNLQLLAAALSLLGIGLFYAYFPRGPMLAEALTFLAIQAVVNGLALLQTLAEKRKMRPAG